MKRLLLSTTAFALLLAASCTSTTEETNVNITDTVNMMPPADNTGPGIEGANPEMLDPNAVELNSNSTGSSTGGSSTSNSAGSSSGNGSTPNSGTNTNAGSSAPGSSRNRGSQEVVVPAAPAKDEIKSTYKRAAPGDTVDGRTNIGSSR